MAFFFTIDFWWFWCVLVALTFFLDSRRKKRRKARRLLQEEDSRNELESSNGISSYRFLELYEHVFGSEPKPNLIRKKDFTGVCVVENKARKKYFVSSSDTILSTTKALLSGRGNQAVYIDFKYGDPIKVRLIRCEDGFEQTQVVSSMVIDKMDPCFQMYY